MRKTKNMNISLKKLYSDLKMVTGGKRNSRFGAGCDELNGMYIREGDPWAHPMSCSDYYSTYHEYPPSGKRPQSAKSHTPPPERPQSAKHKPAPEPGRPRTPSPPPERPPSARPISAKSKPIDCKPLNYDQLYSIKCTELGDKKRKFALVKYHPDKNKTPCAEDIYKQINNISDENWDNILCKK